MGYKVYKVAFNDNDVSPQTYDIPENHFVDQILVATELFVVLMLRERVSDVAPSRIANPPDIARLLDTP